MFFSRLSVALLALLFSVCGAQTGSQAPNSTFHVGVILDLDSLVGRIGQSCLSLALSDFYSSNRNYTSRLVLHVRDSKGQFIDAAAAALDLLKEERVDGIIGPQKSAQASFVIGLGDRAHVPIISFSATSPSLHPQTPYFIQTALSDEAQVGAIASIIEYSHWSQVVVIYEESDYGNGIIPYLSNAFQDVNAKLTYRSVIPLKATDDFMLKELYKMKTMQTRVFVVHMSSSLASRFFLKAKEAGMMIEGYAWIATSGLMDLLYSLDSSVVDAMQGVLGVKPLIPRTRQLKSTVTRWKREFIRDNPTMSHAELSLYGLWAYDTLWALAAAAERVRFGEPSSLLNTSSLNSTDIFTTEISEIGSKIMAAMSEVSFQGLSGMFRLVNGQLQSSSFQILNVVGNGEREVGIWTPSQGISSESNMNFSSSSNKKLKSIIFPGDSTVVPKGWQIPVSGKKFRVGVPILAGFQEFVRVETDPQTNVSKVTGAYIDMFDAVMKTLNYSVPYDYIPFPQPSGQSEGYYDDLTYQVVLENFDAVVADLTITSKRSKVVDFALPFAAGGVIMIVPITYNDPNNKWIFLKPLTKELWLTAIALLIFTGLALWILEHRVNSAFRGPPSQHTGMIFYFPFMSLVFAQRERIVSNLARLVVIVWMFVVLILNSTYTASLSARLTVQRLRPAVTDVNELIRNGKYVGCREGSFIYDLLQGLGFDKSNIRTYKYSEDCDEALLKGSEKAGPTYPTEGFAYALKKGSPLVADVSRAVVELTENGRISEIEGQWMKHQACNGPEGTITTASISLQSFSTIFGIMVGITATCLLVFLVKYLYNNRDSVRRISNSSATVWSKFWALGKLFDQRDPKSFRSTKPREDEEHSSPSLSGNALSSTVVPVLSDEECGADEAISPNSQNRVAAEQLRSPENVATV